MKSTTSVKEGVKFSKGVYSYADILTHEARGAYTLAAFINSGHVTVTKKGTVKATTGGDSKLLGRLILSSAYTYWRNQGRLNTSGTRITAKGTAWITDRLLGSHTVGFASQGKQLEMTEAFLSAMNPASKEDSVDGVKLGLVNN